MTLSRSLIALWTCTPRARNSLRVLPSTAPVRWWCPLPRRAYDPILDKPYFRLDVMHPTRIKRAKNNILAAQSQQQQRRSGGMNAFIASFPPAAWRGVAQRGVAWRGVGGTVALLWGSLWRQARSPELERRAARAPLCITTFPSQCSNAQQRAAPPRQGQSPPEQRPRTVLRRLKEKLHNNPAVWAARNHGRPPRPATPALRCPHCPPKCCRACRVTL